MALLSKQEAASEQLEVRAAAAEERAASLAGELEAKEESLMAERLADVVATQQAEHALQVDEMRQEVAEAKAEVAEAKAAAAAEAAAAAAEEEAGQT